MATVYVVFQTENVSIPVRNTGREELKSARKIQPKLETVRARNGRFADLTETINMANRD